MKLYMAVTPDRLSLPLFVTPYLLEMSEKFNIDEKIIEWETHSNRAKKRPSGGKFRGFKFIRVEVEDDYDN